MKNLTVKQVRDYLGFREYTGNKLFAKIIGLGTGNPDDIFYEGELTPAEVLFVRCYLFIDHNTSGMWHDWHTVIWNLCVREGDRVLDHIDKFITNKDLASIPGSVLAVVNKRYITYTDSKTYYDTQAVEECKSPKAPPIMAASSCCQQHTWKFFLPMKTSNPIQQLLANPDTFTTVLMAIILEHYGTEALEWTPETIFMELRDDFHAELPRQNKDQIVVGINLLTSDDFYTRPSKFVEICNVLAGSELSQSFDKADVVESAWGIAEAYLISPPEDLQHAFHPEILHYLGSVLDDEGIKKPPAILNIALRDSDWSDKSEFETIPTEDPTMFAASYGNREDRTSEIEQVLSQNLSLLFSQLASIPGFEKGVSELAESLQSAG